MYRISVDFERLGYSKFFNGYEGAAQEASTVVNPKKVVIEEVKEEDGDSTGC